MPADTIENIAEITENILHREAAAEAARTAAAAAETACAAHSLMAELVVPRPLVGLLNTSSLGGLLEFLLGAFVPGFLSG